MPLEVVESTAAWKDTRLLSSASGPAKKDA